MCACVFMSVCMCACVRVSVWEHHRFTSVNIHMQRTKKNLQLESALSFRSLYGSRGVCPANHRASSCWASSLANGVLNFTVLYGALNEKCLPQAPVFKQWAPSWELLFYSWKYTLEQGNLQKNAFDWVPVYSFWGWVQCHHSKQLGSPQARMLLKQ